MCMMNFCLVVDVRMSLMKDSTLNAFVNISMILIYQHTAYLHTQLCCYLLRRPCFRIHIFRHSHYVSGGGAVQCNWEALQKVTTKDQGDFEGPEMAANSADTVTQVIEDICGGLGVWGRVPWFAHLSTMQAALWHSDVWISYEPE